MWRLCEINFPSLQDSKLSFWSFVFTITYKCYIAAGTAIKILRQFPLWINWLGHARTSSSHEVCWWHKSILLQHYELPPKQKHYCVHLVGSNHSRLEGNNLNKQLQLSMWVKLNKIMALLRKWQSHLMCSLFVLSYINCSLCPTLTAYFSLMSLHPATEEPNFFFYRHTFSDQHHLQHITVICESSLPENRQQ